MTASVFQSGGALGYMMIGLLAFVLGACVTILCYRMKRMEKEDAFFYIPVLCFVALEYCLWTSSCFWGENTLKNPYFWFDFLMSAVLLSLLPGLRKAVEK